MWIQKLWNYPQRSFVQGYAEFTYSIHKIHHRLGKVPCVLLALVSFILRVCRKETEKHEKTVWNHFCSFGWKHKVKNTLLTYHTVVDDNHNLQILCLVKNAARRLRSKNHQSLTAHRFSRGTTGTARLSLMCLLHLSEETPGQRLTARFFLRVSQENSSSSEKSCSSVTVNTNTSISTHTQNLTAQILSQELRISQE